MKMIKNQDVGIIISRVWARIRLKGRNVKTNTACRRIRLGEIGKRPHVRVRVAGENAVGRVQVGPRGHAGRDEGNVGGPSAGVRPVEDDELVLMGVPVELRHHRVLEPAHYFIELPSPASHGVAEASGDVAHDVNPLPGRFGV